MNQIENYHIITALSRAHLQAQVKDAIRKGWQPFGNCICQGSQWCQPVVSYTGIAYQELPENSWAPEKYPPDQPPVRPSAPPPDKGVKIW